MGTQLSWYIELLTAYFQFNIETTSIQAQFYIDFRLSQFQFNIKNMRIAITFLYFIYCTSILKASPATGRRTLKYDLENEKEQLSHDSFVSARVNCELWQLYQLTAKSLEEKQSQKQEKLEDFWPNSYNKPVISRPKLPNYKQLLPRGMDKMRKEVTGMYRLLKIARQEITKLEENLNELEKMREYVDNLK